MVTFLQEEACCQVFGMSIECKCDVTALCSDMASDALKTTGVAKEQSTAKGNVHRVQADQREASQSDEADCEEGSRKQSEAPKGPEPPHHARRPMNAFLIFCKRHRGVVRDRFPHLENRSVTKILGEWWANLEAQEKASYTELAKQYKEAFLQANPDFKWYKLPAPPLRTLVTRPSNQTRPLKLECDTACGGPITPGKLADETQMGSLSSLLASLPPPPSPAPLTPPPLPPASGPPKPPKKRYLQELGAGEAHHALPTPPVYRLRMAASEETDRSMESRSPFRQLRPSPTVPQKDGVLSEGTTLKTSKQDIIDRVVDRMCRLSDGEGIGSKVSDNNNDAQYPCSKDRSLVGDVDSRCCTGAQSRKNLCHSSDSPGPPVEENRSLEVTTEMDDEDVDTVVPPGLEDFDKRKKEPSAVLEDSEGSADLPDTAVEAGRKYADAINNFFLNERDSKLSSFRSDFRPETANTIADCLNLKKTKASLKEFQNSSCETVGDTISSRSTIIGEFGGSSRESSVSEDSDGSLEKTVCEIKTKDSKDLGSSSDTSKESSSVSSQYLGSECRHQSTDNAGHLQSVANSPGGSSASFKCLSKECSSLNNKFTSRDHVEQLSCSPDVSNSSTGTKTGDNSGPMFAVTCAPKDDSVALSTPAGVCPPGKKISLKTGYLSPKIKKFRHCESTENVKNASGPLKYVKCLSVPTFSIEEQGKEMTISHGNYNRSEESAADFSVLKLEEHISEVVCEGQDVEGTAKEEEKKIDQKLLQVKPSVRTVESATQFDGSTCNEVVGETLKSKHSELKNIYSTALLKYRRVLQDMEGKDNGETKGLATAICHTDDSGIFSPVRYVECKGKSDINCGGEVKDKMTNKISPANTQNKSPMKKLGKLRGPSKKHEHFWLSSGSEIVKIEPKKHFKRRKLDTKIAEDLQTKNVQVGKSASEGFAEGVDVMLPFDILEEREAVSGDRKLVTGGKTSGKCLDLKVQSNVQNSIYSSENLKNRVGTINSVKGNIHNLCRKEKILCKVPFDCTSSESCSSIEINEAVETCDSTLPSVQETARTCNEVAGTARTEENPVVTDRVLKTDMEVDICASVGNIFNGGSGNTHDQSTLNTSSKLLRTSVPAQSFEDGSISVVEESAISELTASSSPVVLDIDLDLTQTRLSPQGLADLAAKDGVVVLTLPVDDELVLPPILSEPHPTVVAVQPTAVECLEVASQTLADSESQDTTANSIVGDGDLLAMDKDASSIESEDSRESMSDEAAALSTKVIDTIPLEASESGLSTPSVKCTEGTSLDSASSGEAAQILSPLTNVDKCLPVVDASEDSTASIQKSEESHEGDSSVARRKSTRTCKGLRYHQFMVEGRLKKGHRRPLSRGSSEKGVKTLRSSSCAVAVHSTGALIPAVPVSSPSDVTCALPSTAVPPVGSSNARVGSSRDVSSGSDPSDAEMDMPLVMRNRFSTPDNMQRIYTTKSKFEKPVKDALEDSMLDSPAKKRFRAADFNLEEKIEALPSLSLEEFQMKKKARKRKPATPLPPLDSVLPLKQTVPSPAVSPDSTEGSNVSAGNRVMLTVEATAVVTSSDGSRLCSTTQLQSTGGVSSTSTMGGVVDVSRQLVGSQKRKARKQSITRLDSDNVHILRDTAVVEPAVLSNIALSSLATIAVTGSKLVK